MDKHNTVYTRDEDEDDMIKNMPLSRRIEIDAILKRSAEKIKRNGLANTMTLEEFREHMDRKFGELKNL